VTVPDRATAFSDAIGGGLLEEIHQDVVTGSRYLVYGDEDRTAKGLQANARAAVLAARLGWIDQADRVGLHGDLLLVGTDMHSRDTNVPSAVLDAATSAGLLPIPGATRTGGTGGG